MKARRTYFQTETNEQEMMSDNFMSNFTFVFSFTDNSLYPTVKNI